MQTRVSRTFQFSIILCFVINDFSWIISCWNTGASTTQTGFSLVLAFSFTSGLGPSTSLSETSLLPYLLSTTDVNERKLIYQRVEEMHSADVGRCDKFVTSKGKVMGKNGNISKLKSRDHLDALPYEVILSEKIMQSQRPILSSSECDFLRQSAEDYWKKAELEGTQTSRFTYQRPGNCEMHVEDLNEKALNVINGALLERIYPWLQNAFALPIDIELSVYDALVIRYNATEAALTSSSDEKSFGAGQPLHRDLGMFSVNIALSDRIMFEGGGTFFEELVSLKDQTKIRFQLFFPSGKG